MPLETETDFQRAFSPSSIGYPNDRYLIKWYTEGVAKIFLFLAIISSHVEVYLQ